MNHKNIFLAALFIFSVARSNDGARTSIKTNQLQNDPMFLTGEGVKIGIWDIGTIYQHQGFSGRLTIVENTTVEAHCTAVCGTLAGSGAGSTDNIYKGVAPGSTLYSYKASLTNNVPQEMLNAKNTYQILVTNNSWQKPIEFGKGDIFGQYEDDSKDFDKRVRDENLHLVFVAGNHRNEGNSYIINRGGYRSIAHGADQAAKNTIVVGAVTKAGAMTAMSGWGPTLDGRLKPDIVAVGYEVISTNTSNGYSGGNDGTSFAAPAVTGGVALLIEQYRRIYSGADPKPALIKSILLNTADDLGNAGPDYQYGYGKVNLLKAIQTLKAGYLTENSVSMDQTRTHTITVPSGTPELRVMMAYSDKESNANPVNALVNDLEFHEVSPSGVYYVPHILDTANPSRIPSGRI